MIPPNRSPANPWVSRPRPNPQARLRLFCLPYAGGGASQYRGWSTLLPPEVEVVPIQLPGREGRLREPPYTRLLPLVGAMTDALQPLLDLPFALFGHSMGAAVSFELARHIRRRYGLSPAHLFASGRLAPQLPDPDPPIHHLPEPQFLEEVKERYDSLPQEVLREPELLQIFLPILRADMEVIETYVYTPDAPFDCPISAFGGTEDWRTTVEELEAWREQTTASFTLTMFEGDHFFVQSSRDPLLREITQTLRGILGR